MDPRTHVDLYEAHKQETERPRRTWPDDGLPAAHKTSRHESLHPYAVFVSAMTRR